MAKMGGNSVIDTVTKMGGAHCVKNGWSSLCQKLVELTVAANCSSTFYAPIILCQGAKNITYIDLLILNP